VTDTGLGAAHLNLAIIGCGAITELAHLPAALRLEHVRVTALVDSNPARAETLAKQYDVPHAVRDVKDLPELPDAVDAAIVALPHDLHAAASLFLLRRGIHVLVEKPMALSIRECDEMIHAARQGNAVLAVGLVRRFLPEIQLAKTIVGSGVLGTILSFDVREGRIYDWKTSSDFPLKRDSAGGGVLTDAGVHVLDTLLYLLGELTVTRYADDSYGGVEAEVELDLAFGGRRTGFVELSRTRELRNTTLIHGADATLEIDLPRRRVMLHRASSTINPAIGERAFACDIFDAQLADWVNAIHARQPPSVDGEQGRKPIALIESCYHSRTLLQLPWVAPKSAGFAPRRRASVMSLRGRRVLVTGGTGFIGCRLVEKLVLEQGACVRVLVRKLVNAARLARLDVDMAHGDVTDPEAVRQAIHGCDVVIHCAYGNDGDSARQRAVNVDGSRIVAEQALQAGVSRMVHASTIAVYGGTPDGDVDECTAFGGPGDHYSQTKREAEQVVMDLHCRRGLPVTIVRPTCVYGPYGLAFTIDPLRELRTRQVVLVNGGEGLCNAVYIDDLVDGMLLAAVEPAAVGEIFLLSGETPLPWRDFYRALEQLLGKCSTIAMTTQEVWAYARNEEEADSWEVETVRRLERLGVAYEPKPRPQPFRIHSEHMLAFYSARTGFRIDKARRLLGFQPAFDFERGMELTGRWARWAGLIPDGPEQ
jgi:predicted dehydrogenase/nucleoside-diphosphate-sugar epimerase